MPKGAFRRKLTGVACAAALILTVGGCGAADMTTQSSPFADAEGARTVTLSVQSWVGAQANTAVAAYLLEKELDYRVDTVQIDEIPGWDALSQGRIDILTEEWGHPEQEKRYVEDKKTVAPGGDLGVDGHIGWFIPKYLADEHPELKSWKNLDKYADIFRTAESGSKGQLLGGSPAYITNDKALINNLDLDFQVVFAGSEAAQITQIRQFHKQKKPFLTYWYTPQWLLEEVPMVEVELPKYSDECAAQAPEDIDCAYPTVALQKYLNRDFAESGEDAAEFLKNFKWSAHNQNEVAQLIADKGLSPNDAAERWVNKHPEVWKKWLPNRSDSGSGG